MSIHCCTFTFICLKQGMKVWNNTNTLCKNIILHLYDICSYHQRIKYLQFDWSMNIAYLKAAYFSSNLIVCQLKITYILTAAPPLFLSLLFVDVVADIRSWMFLSRIFCTLMINMLLSSHSKNMAYFSRFSNFLWVFMEICFKES